jgi:hypothetical protein
VLDDHHGSLQRASGTVTPNDDTLEVVARGWPRFDRTAATTEQQQKRKSVLQFTV